MAGLPKILSDRLREDQELGGGEGMLRFFPPSQRFAVLGFELRTGAETWFIGERRGGAGINLPRNEVSYSKCVRKADLTRVYGKFEIYFTDESGRLNSALKFLPLTTRRKLLSVFGRGQS